MNDNDPLNIPMQGDRGQATTNNSGSLESNFNDQLGSSAADGLGLGEDADSEHEDNSLPKLANSVGDLINNS